MIDKLRKQDCIEYPYIDQNGVSYQSKKNYLQTEILHFCGCGDPDSVMIYVKEFLEKLEKEDWGNHEDLPYMFLSYWADHEELSEHGSNVCYSWLTDKGRELLKDIKWCLKNEQDINS